MNTMSSTKFHHLLYNINILGEELYKFLCFRSNPINYLYLSMYMYVVLNYEKICLNYLQEKNWKKMKIGI